MTTIVGVKKNGFAAIAADSLSTWGHINIPAAHLANHQKILKYEDNYFGFSGSPSFLVILEQWLAHAERKPDFSSVNSIFDSSLDFHDLLKRQYFLRPYDNDTDVFESSRMNILIVNPYGIFSVGALRTVLEYKTFTAIGSGAGLALGAMAALYDRDDGSAESIAARAIEVASEFDDSTALPLNCYTVKLK